MKKINITNFKTGKTWSLTQADPSILTEEKLFELRDSNIATNTWGKPQREIVEFSESYDQLDVLSTHSQTTEEILDENGEVAIPSFTTNYVTLKAEYVIEVKDLDTDPEWLLAECYRKRQAEYPTIQEIGEAIMEKFGENRSGKFDELHAKRISVKNKYPKP